MSSKITPSVRSSEATAGFDLLDTLPEEMFDGIVHLAAQTLRAPFAFFSVIDAQRIWFKAKAGTDINELDVTGSFCAETVLKGSPLVVADATDDTRFAESGIVAGAPYIRFYAGVPVRVNDGQIIGSICVLDVVPRDMSAEGLRILELLGLEIESRLALRAARISEQRLLDERAILMNMILHDARGVLGSLSWSLESLDRSLDPQPEALQHSLQSVGELIRLCNSVSGLGDANSTRVAVELRQEDTRHWFELLGRRATRLAAANSLTLVVDNRLPTRSLIMDIHVLERILMNLIRNACLACAEDRGRSVLVQAFESRPSVLSFSVSDDGPGVPEGVRQRIFEPYFTYRDSDDPGTGLGLAFARLAAHALGGSISFAPREPTGCEFTLEVPVGSGVSSDA